MKQFVMCSIFFLIWILTFSETDADQVEKWILTSEKEVEITSDLAGNRTSWKDWSGETLYTYDHYNYLSSSTSPSGDVTFYKHDPLGRLQKITYPSKQEVTYSYFPGGKIKTVSFLDQIISYTYDHNTNLLIRKETKKVFSEEPRYERGRRVVEKKKDPERGLSTEYAYDEMRRVSDIIHRDSEGSLIAHFQFEYDAMDNVVFTKKSTLTTEISTRYGYDQLYRLIEEIHSDGSFEKYSYDTLGNRLTKDSSKALLFLLLLI
jgi:YD repeat-containing protein